MRGRSGSRLPGRVRVREPTEGARRWRRNVRGMCADATRVVCVVYLLDELAQITERLTENGLDDVARHLVKKLDHKSPIVKQKVRPHSQQERSSRQFEGF